MVFSVHAEIGRNAAPPESVADVKKFRRVVFMIPGFKSMGDRSAHLIPSNLQFAQ